MIAIAGVSDNRPDDKDAGQRNELTPPHSITSSARARSEGGIVRPSAFAVLRLKKKSIRGWLYDR